MLQFFNVRPGDLTFSTLGQWLSSRPRNSASFNLKPKIFSHLFFNCSFKRSYELPMPPKPNQIHDF